MTRRWKLSAALISLLMVSGASSAAPKLELPARINGDWQIVDTQTSQTIQNCNEMQRFAVIDDGRTILLTEPWANFSARYKIIAVQENRMLAAIEGETRLNEQGDPILWWFTFEDQDNFRFRIYDWPAGNVTSMRWTRCRLPN